LSPALENGKLKIMDEVRWAGPAFEHHEKGFFWEVGIIIIAAVIIIISLVWQKNFLFAVFIAIATATIIFWGRKEPYDIEFVINENGLAIGEENGYRYDELSEFSISHHEIAHEGMVEVIFHKKSALSTHIRIPARKEDVARIREILGNFLPEFEHESSLIDHTSRWFKF